MKKTKNIILLLTLLALVTTGCTFASKKEELSGKELQEAIIDDLESINDEDGYRFIANVLYDTDVYNIQRYHLTHLDKNGNAAVTNSGAADYRIDGKYETRIQTVEADLENDKTSIVSDRYIENSKRSSAVNDLEDYTSGFLDIISEEIMGGTDFEENIEKDYTDGFYQIKIKDVSKVDFFEDQELISGYRIEFKYTENERIEMLTYTNDELIAQTIINFKSPYDVYKPELKEVGTEIKTGPGEIIPSEDYQDEDFYNMD